MADDSSTTKINPALVAAIVGSYVGKNSIPVDQIGPLIVAVHQTLSSLGRNAPAPPAAEAAPAVPIRQSVRPDHVVCLECGFRGITLRRHLRKAHGLEPVAYRIRWKLATDHALTAPAYSQRRSILAKQLGLGRKPAEIIT